MNTTNPWQQRVFLAKQTGIPTMPGKLSIVGSMDDITTKEILNTLYRASRSPHHTALSG